MRLEIQKIRQLLALYEEMKSSRKVAKALFVSKSVVNKLLKRIEKKGLSLQQAMEYNDDDLLNLLYPDDKVKAGTASIDWQEVHEWVSNPHVTLQMAYEEVEKRDTTTDMISYSHFCREYREWRADHFQPKASANIPAEPAQTLEIDYSGDLLPWIDEFGEHHKAHIFVAALTYSNYTFAYATPDEKGASWAEGIINALEFLGGCPKILVMDNARPLVAKPSKVEGLVAPLIKDLCEHYSMAPFPCRPHAPKEKNRVEAAVRNVQTWVQGSMEMQGSICVKNLKELNQLILEYVYKLNLRKFRNNDPCSREEKFRLEELPCLAPLPDLPYEPCEWTALTVDKSHCIKLCKEGGHRYSVPVEYLHKIVNVKLSPTKVIIFDSETSKLICTHERCFNAKGPKTHILECHLTEQEKRSRRGPEYFINLFAKRGISREVAQRYVTESWEKDKELTARRRCFAIVANLLYSTEPEILKEALADAADSHRYSYQSVVRLVEYKEELKRRQEPLGLYSSELDPQEDYITPQHSNIRNNYE